MSSTNSTPAFAMRANKLIALLGDAFVATTITSSDDSSPSDNETARATGTGTSISEGAKPPPTSTSTNMLNSHHEVKVPSLANVMPKMSEIDTCFDEILMKVPFKHNRLSLSNFFPNEPHPDKYSLRVQKLGLQSLNHFVPLAPGYYQQYQWILHGIKLKVGDSALRPITTIPLGYLLYDNNLTSWIIALDRLGNIFALRCKEIDDDDLEISDDENWDETIALDIVDIPAFGESLLAVYLGPFEKLQDNYSATAPSASSFIPLDKVTFWESFELSRKMVLEPKVVCHDLASILRDTSSDTSIV